MVKYLKLLLVLVALLFALPVFAQQSEEGELQERTYDFADDIVEGELVRPDGELIEGQIHGR